MLSFKEYITEVFDKPFRWKWDVQDFYADYGAKIKFKASSPIGNDDLLRVFISKDTRLKGEKIHLYFTVNGEIILTKLEREKSIRIFSTVVAILMDFIKRYGDKISPDDVISFESVKEMDSEKSNRARLYERMIKKFLPPGWKFDKRVLGRTTQFEITKK